MAKIVELRDRTNEKLVEMIENARLEMFNLRFQRAGQRLQNPIRLREIRREVAQIQTVLHQRELAIQAASQYPQIATLLNNKEWRADAKYSYDKNGYDVSFNVDGKQVATALVNLNKKRPKTRQERAREEQPELVVGYEVK